MVDSMEMCLELPPCDGPDGRRVLVKVVRHLLRICEVRSDTSEDVSSSIGMDRLCVDKLDKHSNHVDDGVVYEPTLLDLPVLFLHC